MKRRKTTPLPSGSGSHAALCHFKIESPTVTMKSNVNYVVLSFGKLCFCYMCTSGDVSPSECCENELRLVSANLVTFLQFLFSDPSSNYFFPKKETAKMTTMVLMMAMFLFLHGVGKRAKKICPDKLVTLMYNFIYST